MPTPTGVVSVAVLLPGTVSGVVEDTVAVLVTAPGAGKPEPTVIVVVMVRDWPDASVPSAHGNGVVQSPLFDTKVVPAGVASATETATASEGPLLVMTSV